MAKVGGRPIQHTKKLNCGSIIQFYCRGDRNKRNFCVLTKFNEDHNHICTTSMFHQETHKIDNPVELKAVQDAVEMNVKPVQLRKHLQEKFNKPGLSDSHVRYIISRMKATSSNDELAAVLENIDEEGLVKVMLDEQDKVRVLCLQTISMRKAFHGAHPCSVLYDTTFKFNQEGYKLSAFCYTNPVSSRGEVAFLAFIADECSDVQDFVFRSFKECTTFRPKYFMVDKDFNEIRTITKVFPESVYLLCQFHVLKHMKTILSTARASEESCVKVDKELKDALMDSFTKWMYALHEDKAGKCREEFYEFSQGLEVRIGFGSNAYYTNLAEYVRKNWDLCSDKWLTCERRKLEGIEDENTNNRLERLWRSMKDYLKSVSSCTTPISELVVLLVQYAEARLINRYAWQLRHRMRIVHENPEIMQEFDKADTELNDQGMKKFKTSIDLMISRLDCLQLDGTNGSTFVKELFPNSTNLKEQSKIYDCNSMKCNCSWNLMNFAPCRHILFYRLVSGMSLFHKDLFNQKFKIERNCDLLVKIENYLDAPEEELVGVHDVVDDCIEEKIKVLSRGDKYRLLGPKIEMLLEAMLRCGSNKAVKYQSELSEMIENVKLGKGLFIREEDMTARSVLDAVVVSEKYAEPKQIASSEVEVMNASSKYALFWNSKSKLGRVGRPKESKVSFKRKRVTSSNVDASPPTKRVRNIPVEASITDNRDDIVRQVADSHCAVDNTSSSLMESDGTLSDMCPGKTSVSDAVVCSFPYDPDNPRQYAVYESDIKSLAPRAFIKDTIIDYCFRKLKSCHSGSEQVLLIDSSKSQRLSTWRLCPDLRSDIESARLFHAQGVRLVFMVWCESVHFFGIVGVCHIQNPVVYVLESVGGYPEPLGAQFMIQLLHDHRVAAGLPLTQIRVLTPLVPRQPVASNDCGIFVVENASRIFKNPDEFLERASQGSLKDWYKSNELSRRRIEIAAELRKLGAEQNYKSVDTVVDRKVKVIILTLYHPYIDVLIFR